MFKPNKCTVQSLEHAGWVYRLRSLLYQHWVCNLPFTVNCIQVWKGCCRGIISECSSRKVALYPGLLTPAFVTCRGRSSHVQWRTWTRGTFPLYSCKAAFWTQETSPRLSMSSAQSFYGPCLWSVAHSLTWCFSVNVPLLHTRNGRVEYNIMLMLLDQGTEHAQEKQNQWELHTHHICNPLWSTTVNSPISLTPDPP